MSGKVRVALAGVGNCASSLVQGIEFYRDADPTASIPGLMHVELGGYHIRDIEFSAAFDVSDAKVGKDLASAIRVAPNNTIRFAEVSDLGVKVRRGPTMDGLGRYLRDLVQESRAAADDVVRTLRETATDVLVCYLPVGSQEAAIWYAEQALAAGCAFVNCIPVFIASREKWRHRFVDARLPLIGDDIKSQLGATITHRVLTDLFRKRGVKLERNYQLKTGGNTDFLNILNRARVKSKKHSKTEAVQSVAGERLSEENIHIGPSDFVPWQKDNKVCFIRMEGRIFGDVPVNIELRLSVEDSPNSAGVAIDAIRCAKLALERGQSGVLHAPSAFFYKHPPFQIQDDEAFRMTEAFIKGGFRAPHELADQMRQEIPAAIA